MFDAGGDAGAIMGTGDLDLFQTSTNTATVNLNNANQPVGSLSSHFTATTGGSATVDSQYLNIGDPTVLSDHAHALTVTQTKDASFGYGAVSTLTATIQGGGSLVLAPASTKTLTLTGPNTFTGGTVINGGTLNIANGTGGALSGSATGTGDVTINSGGRLTSGGGIVVLGSPVTTGTISGQVIVNSGGIVAPGGTGTVGTLNIGSLNAHTGSIFNIDLIGGTNASSDLLVSTGAATLDVGGNEIVNIAGSKLAFGNYQIGSFSSLTNAGTTFTLGTTPGGANRVYSLSTTATGLFLNIVDTGSERFWSATGGNPAVDGAGTWSVGGTTFFNTNPNTVNAAYDNASNNDVIIGNAGAGGTITLGSALIRVGGTLVLSPVTTPYTIGVPAGTNSLQLAKGLAAGVNATINAPIILEATQTFSVSSGATLTSTGGISELSGTAKTLTKDDLGTLILTGAGAYTGGTVISAGVLQGTTTSIPTTGGVSNSASLVFSQATSGTYSGAISGAGTVTINNTVPAASVILSGANTYTGATLVQGGVLSVGSLGNLGTGAGGIILSGGTLKATGALSFPANGGAATPTRTVTLTAGTTSTVDTGGFNVVFNQNIGGAGNLIKAGAGDLTLTGLPSTTVIGTVGVTQGSLTLAPPANIPSFGISASATPGTLAGDLVIATPMELRLYGGDFSGGGFIRVKPSSLNIVSRGTVTIGNSIVLNDNVSPTPGFTVNIGANALNSLALNGPIIGQSDVNFTGGAGNVTLGGVSTYTGATTIDNGSGGEVQTLVNNALPATTALRVTSSGVLNMSGKNQTVASLDATNAAATIYNGGTTPSVLTINGSANTIYAGFLLDGQTSTLGLTLAPTHTGSLSLTGTNTFTGSPPTAAGLSGPINIAGGRLDSQTLGALGAPSLITVGVTSNNSQLRFSGLVGTLTYASTLNPTASPSPITLAGLGGYNPGTGIEPGALRVTNASTLSVPSNITFAADASIAVTSDSALTLTGTLSGSGALMKQGGGPLTITAANAAYSGGTQMLEGTLTVNAGAALGTGPLVVANLNTGAGTAVALNLNNASQTVGSLSGAVATPSSGSNQATINLGANHTLTVNQTTAGNFAGTLTGATGSLIKSGPETLTLSGGNSYGGTTTVAAGTLLATTPAALPGTGTPGKIIVQTGATLSAQAGGTGWTSANLATLQTNATFASGSTLGIDVPTGGTFTYGGVITGSKGLTKNQPGTLNLTGTSTYTGGTTVNAGIVDASGGSILASAGPMTVTGTGTTLVANRIRPSSLTINGGGMLRLTATASSANVLGSLTIPATGSPAVPAGTLDLNNHSMVVRNELLADASALILSGRANGAWNGPGINSSAAAANPDYGIGFYKNGTPGSPVVTSFDGETGLTGGEILMRYALLGDTDLNGVVNLTDLNTFAANFGKTADSWATADVDGNGVVNLTDLNYFSSNFGKSAVGVPAGTVPEADFAAFRQYEAQLTSVPEPTTLGGLGLAMFGLLARRRRSVKRCSLHV